MKKTGYSVLGLIVLSVSVVVSAAPTAYMTITGESQGLIPGSCQRTGRQDTIEVYGYTINIAAAIDEKCFPTGQLAHRPVTVVKRIDRATTALLQALKTNEFLQVSIDFYDTDPTGTETLVYTVTLKNARLSGVQQEQLNNLNPEGAQIVVLEKIALTYAEIREQWHPHNTETAAAWKADCTEPLSGDLNFDGIVNLKDFILMADDWLLSTH